MIVVIGALIYSIFIIYINILVETTQSTELDTFLYQLLNIYFEDIPLKQKVKHILWVISFRQQDQLHPNHSIQVIDNIKSIQEVNVFL